MKLVSFYNAKRSSLKRLGFQRVQRYLVEQLHCSDCHPRVLEREFWNKRLAFANCFGLSVWTGKNDPYTVTGIAWTENLRCVHNVNVSVAIQIATLYYVCDAGYVNGALTTFLMIHASGCLYVYCSYARR